MDLQEIKQIVERVIEKIFDIRKVGWGNRIILFYYDEFVEYEITTDDYENFVIRKSNVELYNELMYKFIIPDNPEQFETVLRILENKQ